MRSVPGNDFVHDDLIFPGNAGHGPDLDVFQHINRISHFLQSLNADRLKSGATVSWPTLLQDEGLQTTAWIFLSQSGKQPRNFHNLGLCRHIREDCGPKDSKRLPGFSFLNRESNRATSTTSDFVGTSGKTVVLASNGIPDSMQISRLSRTRAATPFSPVAL